MATARRPIDRARRRIEDDLRRVLSEIDLGRRNAGLSHDAVGAACHMSGSTIARTLAGEIARPDIRLLAEMAAAVGQELRLRAFPAGDPIRDGAQQRLLARFRARVSPGIRWRTEVPLPLAGDLRAWDAMLNGSGWSAAVEAETVLDDLQALERRIALKRRDGAVDRVILVISDTARNRRALAAAPGAFADFDRAARNTLRALAAGIDPGRSAILLL
jgi:transcriptional regulator with XRE-family HTH domain